MNTVGMTAQCNSAFDGAGISLSSPTIIGDSLSINAIEHNSLCKKYATFFVIPEHHKERSKAIPTLLSALQQSYHKPKQSLKSLNKRSNFKLTHYIPNRLFLFLNSEQLAWVYINFARKLIKKRQSRSERREACITLLQSMLYYQDDQTGIVGSRNGDIVYNTSIKKIASRANLKLRTALRAMSDIVNAGYLHTKKQYKRLSDGRFIGLPSFRQFTVKLFQELGGSNIKRFYSLQTYKEQKARKALNKNKNKEQQQNLSVLNRMLKTAVNSTTLPAGGHKNTQTMRNFNGDSKDYHEQNLKNKNVPHGTSKPRRSLKEITESLAKKFAPKPS